MGSPRAIDCVTGDKDDVSSRGGVSSGGNCVRRLLQLGNIRLSRKSGSWMAGGEGRQRKRSELRRVLELPLECATDV